MSFFSNLSDMWINFFTVVGAIVSILLGIYAIWLTVKFNKENGIITAELSKTTKVVKEYTEEINTTSKLIKKATEKINETSDLIKNHTKTLRLESLRTFYELSENTPSRSYWHFIWRFETFDQFTCSLYIKNKVVMEGDSEGEGGSEEKKDRKFIGTCTVEVLGSSQQTNIHGFENKPSVFYVVKLIMIDMQDSEVKGFKFPYQTDSLLACFHSNNEIYISLGTDSWTDEKKYILVIAGLGRPQFGTKELLANEFKYHPRIKDT